MLGPKKTVNYAPIWLELEPPQADKLHRILTHNGFKTRQEAIRHLIALHQEK